MSSTRLSGLSALAQGELDSLLHNGVEQGAVPNVVAIVANRAETLYQCAVGASPLDIYRIASMTKGIFNTHFWADPQQGIAVVVFTQLLPGYDVQVMQLLHDFEATIYRHLVTGAEDLP
jgi:hypothetical protein